MAARKQNKIQWGLAWTLVVAAVIIGVGKVAFEYAMEKLGS